MKALLIELIKSIRIILRARRMEKFRIKQRLSVIKKCRHKMVPGAVGEMYCSKCGAYQSNFWER